MKKNQSKEEFIADLMVFLADHDAELYIGEARLGHGPDLPVIFLDINGEYVGHLGEYIGKVKGEDDD